MAGIWDLGKPVFDALKAGNLDTGDYFEIEADGTDIRKGEATVWDDIVRSLAGRRLESSAGRLDYDWEENAIIFQNNGDIGSTADRLIFNLEYPHSAIANGGMHLHIHWEQTSTNKIEFTTQYRVQANNAPKVTTWTTVTSNSVDNSTFTYTSGTLIQITELGVVDLTGAGISATVQFRLARTDSTTGNILGTFVDAHVERDMLGSRSEYVK